MGTSPVHPGIGRRALLIAPAALSLGLFHASSQRVAARQVLPSPTLLVRGETRLSAGQEAGAKKNKKKCKKSPHCPESCAFVFYTPDGDEICGIGYSLQNLGAACVPCGAATPCTSASYPNCLNSVKTFNTGVITYFTNPCGAYTEGVCGNVSACVT